MTGRWTREQDRKIPVIDLIWVLKLCSKPTLCLGLHVAQAVPLTKAFLFSHICPVSPALGELPLFSSWKALLENLAFPGTSVLGEW